MWIVVSFSLFYPFAGTTQSDIPIRINSDFEPETVEEFQIVLTVENGDVVLVYPSVTLVTINANDKTHGVLSLKTSQGITFPTYNVSEDRYNEFSDVTLIRNGGAFGVVTIAWEIVRNDSSGEPIRNDITPSSGVVTFEERQKEQRITFNIVQDEAPEVWFQFLC